MSDVIDKIMKMAREINEKYKEIDMIEKKITEFYLGLSDSEKKQVAESLIDEILSTMAKNINVSFKQIKHASESLRLIGEESGVCKILEHLTVFFDEVCGLCDCTNYHVFMDEMDNLYKKHSKRMMKMITRNYEISDDKQQSITNEELIRDAIENMQDET